MLATAKTPAVQQKLAAYDHEKARQLTAEAQDPAEHADQLATPPATSESKQGVSCQCTSQYGYFSRRYAEEVKQAEVLAAQHDHLAQELSSGGVQEECRSNQGACSRWRASGLFVRVRLEQRETPTPRPRDCEIGTRPTVQ